MWQLDLHACAALHELFARRLRYTTSIAVSLSVQHGSTQLTPNSLLHPPLLPFAACAALGWSAHSCRLQQTDCCTRSLCFPCSVRDPQLECFYSALRPCPSLHIIGDKASCGN